MKKRNGLYSAEQATRNMKLALKGFTVKIYPETVKKSYVNDKELFDRTEKLFKEWDRSIIIERFKINISCFIDTIIACSPIFVLLLVLLFLYCLLFSSL